MVKHLGTPKDWVLIAGGAIISGVIAWLCQSDSTTPAVNAAAAKIDTSVKAQGTLVSTAIQESTANIIAADGARHEQTRTELQQSYLKPLVDEGRIPYTDGSIVYNPSAREIRIWAAEFKPDMTRAKQSRGVESIDPEYEIHFSNKNYYKETGSYQVTMKDLVVPAHSTAVVVPVITNPEAVNREIHGELILYYGATSGPDRKNLVIRSRWYEIQKN